MKYKLIIPTLIASMLLVGCGPSDQEQRIVDEVSQNGAICMKTTGSSTQILFEGGEANYIYKPTSFNPREHPDWIQIYSTTILLSVWFDYDLEAGIKPTLSWSFSDAEVFKINYPTNEAIAHATVQITSYPELNTEVSYTLNGSVSYKGATAEMKYIIVLKSVNPNSEDNA